MNLLGHPIGSISSTFFYVFAVNKVAFRKHDKVFYRVSQKHHYKVWFYYMVGSFFKCLCQMHEYEKHSSKHAMVLPPPLLQLYPMYPTKTSD